MANRRGIADRLGERLLAIFIWLLLFIAIAFPTDRKRKS